MRKTSLTNILFGLLLPLIFLSCNGYRQNENSISKLPELKEGKWRMVMNLGEASLPFNFLWQNKVMTVLNGIEKISLDTAILSQDSLIIKHPVFESEFRLKVIDSLYLEGYWINYYKGSNYKIPVKAFFGESYRFFSADKIVNSNKNISGKYKVIFSPESEQTTPAIGIFNQNESILTGSFATETGDYRYLEGVFVDDSIYLSTFDGSHAFLFKAFYTDSLVSGIFWSGIHWKENWTAKPSKTFNLKNPDSLTFMRAGNNNVSFKFPNTKGIDVSFPGQRFKNKVSILQIMGSWCPNCLDETEYLSTVYKKYNSQGLEVIALAFERTRSRSQALKNINRLKKKVGADYEFLLAGTTKADKPTDVFPMLNHIMSYPTTLFIDKKGKVRKIHTGFYGPGTGDYYINFVNKTDVFIQQLLSE